MRAVNIVRRCGVISRAFENDRFRARRGVACSEVDRSAVRVVARLDKSLGVGCGSSFWLRGVTSGSQCIQGDMTPHQVSTGSSLLSVLVIRGRSCRIGGSIRARGGSVIPLPLITTGGVRTVARCRSRTTSYVGRQYRQAAVLDFNYGSPARHGAESGAAIFLHYATRYTAGCVSMDSLSKLTNTLRWIDPAQNPKIIILG